MRFNYSKLRGKIREICGTQASFAKQIGLSQTSLSYKLNGNVDFDQSEIAKASGILKLHPEEISIYFFTPEVQKK